MDRDKIRAAATEEFVCYGGKTIGAWQQTLNERSRRGNLTPTDNAVREMIVAMTEQRDTILTLLKELDEAEKLSRCPCGGQFEGTGYYHGEAIFNCNKCDAQFSLSKEVWDKILHPKP